MPGRFLKYWLPLILWMVLIFGISTDVGSHQHTSRFIGPFFKWLIPGISQEALDAIHYCVRKGGHLTEYAILAVLIWRALRSEAKLVGSRSVKAQFVLVVLASALYASSDEFHQSFNPAREGRAMDVLIDTCGAGGGALAFAAWIGRRKR